MGEDLGLSKGGLRKMWNKLEPEIASAVRELSESLLAAGLISNREARLINESAAYAGRLIIESIIGSRLIS